jgi:hypothetical protein
MSGGMNGHQAEVAGVSVGALVGAGKFLSEIEPILASISYMAAILVAVVTIYYKIRNSGTEPK